MAEDGQQEAVEVQSPVTGTVVAVLVAAGERVRAGQRVALVESMKMEYPVESPTAGVVLALLVPPGTSVRQGETLCRLAPGDGGPVEGDAAEWRPVGSGPGTPGPAERPEVAAWRARRALVEDEARPAAVARHKAIGHRTARENVADLLDEGSFQELGSLVVAAQRARRSREELERETPADGLVCGLGRVNGELFPERAACAVLAYDYTVLAGTQGQMNHRKKDRLLEVVERLRVPLVLFGEGGGGRPGDTDTTTITGLDTMAFALMARLSGLVPLVGIAAGRCFAGNAALLGCCDVLIATADANLGMGGPAMIEGGGLGRFAPEEIGPLAVQEANGVVDLAVADEAEAVAVAKRYLGYFQGPLATWEEADQAQLAGLLPARRTEVYDVRRILEVLADQGSVLELRPRFAPGMVTALARLEGRPVGVLANNPLHLGGAIDAAGAAKAARFVALCDAFDLPLVSLVDTPGFLVGPAAEAEGLVRQAGRLFVVGASVQVPWVTVVLRKAYGLGAQAMAGGSFRTPLRTVAWPTGELGGMGLEGAVRLGFRRELAEADDPEALYEQLVAAAYERGKAVSVAEAFELDEVVDPARTRQELCALLRSAPPPPARVAKKRPGLGVW
ncbi:carboxyl transferase domain-containing protein [Aciditerrimonas ferrireducens]|uniref:carboxyl transferase domain-containing protein n=1 Tax=Aciditerrimonas ferrireducens TaxID=667306 RepID=UPI002004044E|nr:carboxyl transferase domain-containing protein [Aciditerrimonas ferrireducens]MCK4176593.1 biotin carboxylase [Aciditerrimonas ferrireducens]